MKKTRAMTFPEILLMVAIMALVLGMGLSKGRNSSLTCQALAGQIASDLRLLRAEAVAGRSPLGMGFPRQGTSLHCQSYYLLRGMERPQAYRSHDLSSSGLSFLPCIWGTTTQSAPSRTSYLDLAAWGLPHAQDAMIAFDSRGQLCTNLPLVEGECTLYCGKNFSYSDQSGTALLLKSGESWGVQINRAGRVALISGFVGQFPGVAVNAAPAPVRPPSRSASQSPSLTVTVSPPPGPGVPATVVASCLVGRFLTLNAESRDPDGDSLMVQWRSPEGGQFSSPQALPMEWQPRERCWRSRWTWTPPPTAVTGDLFTLICRVSDSRGNSVEKKLETTTATQVLALNDGSIYFSSDRSGAHEVYRCNSDGSDCVALTNIRSLDVTNPVISPDGSKIIVRYNGGVCADFWMINRDGSNFRRITDVRNQVPPGTWGGTATWSPDGRKIVYSMIRGTDEHEIRLCNLDGSGDIRLSHALHPIEPGFTLAHAGRPRWYWQRPPGPNPIYDPTDLSAHRVFHSMGWGAAMYATALQNTSSSAPPVLINSECRDFNFNRDFTKVAYIQANGGWEVKVADWDGSNYSNPVMIPGSWGSWSPSFSPDGRSVTFCGAPSGDNEIFVSQIDGSNFRRISNNTANDQAYSWGP